MKNIKPSIVADILILFAFVLGMNGGLNDGLFPEKFKEPISSRISLRKREQINQLPEFLHGNFVSTIHKKSITKVDANTIDALGKRWLIQKKGEVFLENSRAYRAYALEEKTGVAWYFTFQLVNDFWVLNLNLETPNSTSQKAAYWLGEKKDTAKSWKLDYRWVLLLICCPQFFLQKPKKMTTTLKYPPGSFDHPRTTRSMRMGSYVGATLCGCRFANPRIYPQERVCV